MQQERDELYRKFVKAIHEVQQKSNFKNLLLEKKLGALADTLEKKEAQLNEVLSASNLDPTALTVVTRKLEVRFIFLVDVGIEIGNCVRVRLHETATVREKLVALIAIRAFTHQWRQRRRYGCRQRHHLSIDTVMRL